MFKLIPLLTLISNGVELTVGSKVVFSQNCLEHLTGNEKVVEVTEEHIARISAGNIPAGSVFVAEVGYKIAQHGVRVKPNMGKMLEQFNAVYAKEMQQASDYLDSLFASANASDLKLGYTDDGDKFVPISRIDREGDSKFVTIVQAAPEADGVDVEIPLVDVLEKIQVIPEATIMHDEIIDVLIKNFGEEAANAVQPEIEKVIAKYGISK